MDTVLVQIASVEKPEKSSNKPEMGHFAKAKTTPKESYSRDQRL